MASHRLDNQSHVFPNSQVGECKSRSPFATDFLPPFPSFAMLWLTQVLIWQREPMIEAHPLKTNQICRTNLLKWWVAYIAVPSRKCTIFRPWRSLGWKLLCTLVLYSCFSSFMTAVLTVWQDTRWRALLPCSWSLSQGREHHPPSNPSTAKQRVDSEVSRLCHREGFRNLGQ